jgi:hypothetical protein
MKQKIIPLFIMMALLAAPLTVGAAGKNTLTVDEVKARAVEAQAKRREVVVKLRPGTKILVGDKAFPFEFLRSASLSGRIKEMRENDFTLSSASPRTGEVTAVISYADVSSIKRPPSGFEKVLKNVGKYSLRGAAGFAILPLYGILALSGRLPRC